MLDGIYSITFRGAVDFGIGVLILQKGSVIGADSGGVQYDGNYVERENLVDIDLIMTVPPGATLVQGTKARPQEYRVPIKATLPAIVFERGQPARLELEPGPVNVIFRFLRKF